MSNLHTIELRLTAENHIVSVAELSTDPDMQMRTKVQQETVEQYADNIEAILKEHPIDVVEVEDALETQWYIVDGFHRYHAALFAGVEEVSIRLMKGSYADAVQYAMSANWENGLRPNKDDAQRSIGILLGTMPDFGYDSKKVIKWLETFGIPKTTARDNTKKLRESIDDKRDAKILEMLSAGASEKQVVETVGCSKGTVGNVKRCAQNERPAQNGQEEDSCPFDPASDFTPFFDEDECDTTPAINPADAFNKALAEHEEERKETTRQQDNSVSKGMVDTSGKSPLEEAAGALALLSDAWQKHGKEVFAELLKSDSHAGASNVSHLLEISELAKAFK